VSNSVSNKSPAIAFQFKRIISELKKMASKVQGMDAKYGDMLKVLSNTADANFNEIRKKDVEGVEGEGEDVEDVEVEDVEVEDVEGEDVEGEGVEGVEVEGVEVEGVEVEGVEGGV
jgi:DNA anti-recombination protein RmuC